ncbi:10551_t:CDS:2, partial [Cetraspora pellucida]
MLIQKQQYRVSRVPEACLKPEALLSDEEHYLLQINQFQIQPDGGILFYRYHSKNNQQGIQGGDAHQIHLPPNPSDIFSP